jgi:restriction system protein
MPIPEFNEIKAPALEYFADGQPHKTSEVFKTLGKCFRLTEQDLAEVLPSGTQLRWHNRAGWALYDLYRAGLLDRIKKGVYVISELGKQVAAEKPEKIDRDYLMRFPQFAQFIEKSTKSGSVSSRSSDQTLNADHSLTATTPEEQLATLASAMNRTLAADLLDQVKEMDPFRFERLVLDLLLAMGYGGSREEAAVAGKGVNDGGIDGLINEDRLGLDRIYVQAKRWQNNVGRPEIQNFVGALAGQHAHKGIFITTSEFSKSAVEYAKNLPQRVILIDGQRLAELMIEHNIGVSLAYSYEIKRIDSDYFEEP